VQELYGHSAFVYSLSLLPSGELLSGGEDQSVRVWKNGEQNQVLTQPCISVWAVLGLSNGDLVAAGSDGYIRVFSRDPKRLGTEDELLAFQSLVSSNAIPAQVGDLKKDDVLGPDALEIPGSKEGEVKMVRNGGMVEAHQWDSMNGKWQKIGEVVNAIKNDRRNMFEGKEYDYIFDVDFKDGVPPLKLPYNLSDNPFVAAQAFIDRNELPQSYLEQIANFITTNSKAVTIGPEETPSGFADPFTGENRYAPAGSTAPKTALIPATKYVTFKVANVKAIHSKILGNSAGLGDLALSETEMTVLETTIKTLDSGNSSSGLKEDEWKVLAKIAFEWPEGSRFPGIDLVRLSILHTGATKEINSGLLDKILQCVSNSSSLTKTQEIDTMLSLRAFCNVFAHPECIPHLDQYRSHILDTLKILAPSTQNKNLLIAINSLLMNMSILILNKPSDGSYPDLLADCLHQSIQNPNSDDEGLLRGLIALGSLIEKGLISKTKLTSLKQVLLKGTGSANSSLKEVSNHLNLINL